MEKIRLLMIGDSPTIPTGFGRVGKSIAKFLSSDEYQISWLGVNYWGDPHEFPYRIYPAGLNGDIYGIKRLTELIEKEKPQIIWILNDAWVQTSYLETIKAIKEANPQQNIRIVTYTPVDAVDHNKQWYKNFDTVDTAVVYTQFGFEEVLRSCPELEGKLTIIPHGVDTETFYKLPGTRKENKIKFYPRKEFGDYFILLSAHRNQPRKRLDITIHGFSEFAKGKEDVRLYMHCGVTDESMDIVLLARRFGVDNKLLISGLTHGIMRVTDDQLNKIYNVTDVGLNTGLGEGWGLPNMEHALTGAPQIVPAHSALNEIWDGIAEFVPAKIPYVLDNIMTTGRLVTAEDVAKSMEILYANKERYNELSEAGLKKFTSNNLQWKTIAGTWDKIFKQLV